MINAILTNVISKEKREVKISRLHRIVIEHMAGLYNRTPPRCSTYNPITFESIEFEVEFLD